MFESISILILTALFGLGVGVFLGKALNYKFWADNANNPQRIYYKKKLYKVFDVSNWDTGDALTGYETIAKKRRNRWEQTITSK